MDDTQAGKAVPDPVSIQDARRIIRKLNKLNLDTADYAAILETISRLTIGLPLRFVTTDTAWRIYRGRKMETKPISFRELSYPPAENVIDFERCNAPQKPMFYGSHYPGAVFYELALKPGDTLYLSKWSITKNFLAFQIASEFDEGIEQPARDVIFSFYESWFAHRVHSTFSSDYKITAAIAEHLTRGTAYNGVTGQEDRKMGGLLYPSVRHHSEMRTLLFVPTLWTRVCNGTT